MIPFRPGEIIQQVMNAHLEIVAIGDALIEPQKSVPRLVVVAHNAEALPRVSPTEGIGESRAKNSGIAEGEPFAMVCGVLLGSVSGQEGGSGVSQILHGAAPEDQVPAVGGETIIHARAEGPIQISRVIGNVEHGGINPGRSPWGIGIGATPWVEVHEIAGRQGEDFNRSGCWIDILIPEDTLA